MPLPSRPRGRARHATPPGWFPLPRPASWRRRRSPLVSLIAAWGLVGAAFVALPFSKDPDRVWTADTRARHARAAASCAAARAVGLAPSYRGEPGYWPQHDRDRDGVACEPWWGRW